ncbi:hypothetical protein Pelo_12557 [Pelomyxa schiedti]|nr:hypothetical protein Pelo_12557 [Pelomyxa schiedti]
MAKLKQFDSWELGPVTLLQWRTRGCMHVGYHTETLEQFLRHLTATAAPQTATTPWPIVHKYAMNICAGLVHLFKPNQHRNLDKQGNMPDPLCKQPHSSQASFTPTDIEFMRAVINKQHRTTVPELVLTALWTKHISHEVDNVTGLLLQKIPTAANQQDPVSATRFLSGIIYTQLDDDACTVPTFCSDESAESIWVGLSKIPERCDNPPTPSTSGQIHWGSSSMSSLGLCYYWELGLTRTIGRQLFCSRGQLMPGNVNAMRNLGWCYKHGEGVDKDMSKAVALFQKAADCGHTKAIRALGECYHKGREQGQGRGATTEGS